MTRRTQSPPDEILARARVLVEESEEIYERFLDAWGIDRAAMGRAARGEHIRSPRRRRELELALEHVELPANPPLPTIPGVETRFPPHAIRC